MAWLKQALDHHLNQRCPDSLIHINVGKPPRIKGISIVPYSPSMKYGYGYEHIAGKLYVPSIF